MTKGINKILLLSQLNTTDRLYVPKAFSNSFNKDNYIKILKKQIKQIDNGDK